MHTLRALAAGLAGVALMSGSLAAEPRAAITVAVDGKPVAAADTPEAALRLVSSQRQAHPNAVILVEFPARTYRIATPLLIGAAESGTASASLILRGALHGGTVIKGSVAVPFSSTIDPAQVAGLSAPALRYRSYLRQDVAADPMIFANGHHLGLSRWPARSYLDGWQVKSVSEGTFLSHPRFAAPLGAAVLVTGYLTADWAFETIPGRTVAGGILLPGYRPAVPPQARVRLAVLNLDRDDARGHYRLDDGRIVLAGVAGDHPVEIATARELLVVERASNVAIENIAFEHSAGNGLRIYVSNHIALRNCYVGGVGGHGISVDGGDHVTITGCVVTDTGLSGITLFGGDRATLTSSGHVVSDTIVSDTSRQIRTYAPAVAMLGTGNRLTRSRIFGLPHSAVGVSGNDNRVDATDIHAVACETGDVGAIYMGRDWTQRGNRIDGNFLHDLGSDDPALGNSAVYLDDQFSGAEISGNVVLRVGQGVVIGGGRDNLVADNVFAQIRLSAIWLDQRGLDVQKADTVSGGVLYETLMASPFRSAVWRTRYPDLATLPDDRPGAAIGNRVSGNVVLGATFVHGDPSGTILALSGNREAALPMLSGKTPDRQFALLHRLTGTGGVRQRPGPAGRPLHAARVSDVSDCGTFSN